MKTYAYAKINAALNVVARREDGYHELEMIMLPLTLCDDVGIELASEDQYTWDINEPINEKNTIVRAVELMRHTYDLPFHFHVDVKKRIPMQAGLAGGSADAAAVMLGINQLCQLNKSKEELAALGVKIGADVPFCVMSQPCAVYGIGEVLHPFCMKSQFHILLLKPQRGVSTKECFEGIDFSTCIHPDIHEVKRCLMEADDQHLISCVGNTLEASAFQLVPEIEEGKKYLIEKGFDVVCMSGSGSSIFAFTKNESLIDETMNDSAYSSWFKCKTSLLCEQ